MSLFIYAINCKKGGVVEGGLALALSVGCPIWWGVLISDWLLCDCGEGDGGVVVATEQCVG